MREKNKAEEKKTDFIIFLIPKNQKEKLKELAKKEQRSLSNFCYNAISLYVSSLEVSG